MKKIKSWIDELKKTDRGKAILKLSGYMVFFVAVLAIIGISNVIGGNNDTLNLDNTSSNSSESTSSDDKTVSAEVKSLTYLEKQEKIYNGSYDFIFKITGETEVNYSGSFSNDVVEGYKESKISTLKYRIENGVTYEINLDEKKEITDLYAGLDASLFDFKTMFDKLNSKSTSIDRSTEYKTYTYENVDGYKYVVTMNDTEITKINISNESLNYEMIFTY